MRGFGSGIDRVASADAHALPAAAGTFDPAAKPASGVVTAGPLTNTGRGKLDALQALRFLAASLVVIDHAVDRSSHLAGATPRAADASDPLINIGLFGVGIFFVISGFIMVYTSDRLAGSVRGVAEFVRRRVLRIVPIYWIATAGAAMLALKAANGDATPAHILKSLLFIPYYSQAQHGHMRPLLGQGWTLDYEMFFYALFAATLLLPRRSAVWACLAMLAGLVLLRPLVVGAGAIADTWTGPLLLLFGVGMGLARARLSGRVRPLHVAHPFAWACGIAALGWFASTALPQPAGLAAMWLMGVAAVALCALSEGGGRLPGGGLAVRLGDASYSTYLFHQFVLFGYQRAVLRLAPETSALVFVLGALIVCHAAGYGLFRGLERPLTRWLTRITSPPRVVAEV